MAGIDALAYDSLLRHFLVLKMPERKGLDGLLAMSNLSAFGKTNGSRIYLYIT